MERGDDPYKILGISKTASEDEVKKAYRKLALKHHPDRQSDDKAKDEAQHIFAKISGAYEILGDEKQRKKYDSVQEEQKKSGGKTRGFDEDNVEGDFHFKSPYEVWKRDFEAQFGFPYPGAKYDLVDPSRRVENGPANTSDDDDEEAAPAGKGNKKKKGAAAAPASNHKQIASEAGEDKPRGFFGRLFGRKNPKDETALVLHTGEEEEDDEPKKGKGKPNSSKKNAPQASSTTMAAASNETALVKSNGVAGDNRPISMETTTKQIKHDDGTIETITEIKMVRPDGSIERCRTSDCAEKRKDWKQAVKSDKKATLPQLTNGGGDNDKPRKQLTGGESSSKPAKNADKHLALTNGETSSSKKKSSSSKSKKSSSSSTALTVKE